MAARGAVWILPCKFDVVFKKSGLLMGAFREGEVVKLFGEFQPGTGHNRRAENVEDLVRGEYTGASAAMALGVRVPAIRGYDNSPVRYVRQELVHSRKPPKDAASNLSLVRDVLQEIDKLCKDSEVKFMSLSAMPAARDAVARLRKGMDAMSESHPTLADFARTNLHLLESAFLAAEIPVHGDLCRGNILVETNGSLCLCDWERYGRSLFGYDVFTLIVSLFPDQSVSQVESIFSDPYNPLLGPNALAVLRETGLRNSMGPSECGQIIAATNFLIFLSYMTGAPDKDSLGRHLENCKRALSQ